MILVNKLSMAYGDKLLFYDATLNLNDHTHYALVGANGAGKSTFFKLITGEEEASDGEITVPNDAVVGWLKQDQYLYENTLIRDIVIQGKQKLWEAFVEKDKLQDNWDENAHHKLAELEETIAHFNGYSAHAFAEKLLIGLGIPVEYHQKPLSALSGGFKLRVLLAKVLFQEPDILLLDEPTNHLDIISIRWLERYLKNEFRGLLIYISHDVEFINSLADYILDIDYGEVRQYSGRYEKFLLEKKLVEEQKLNIKNQLERKITEMQSFVDRFGAKASKARQAQSRMKMIEKIELQLPDVKNSSRITPHFHFKPHRSSGKRVIQVKGLSKQFKEKKLFSNVNFEIARGEKVAIMGENGVGKSTLVKILVGKLAPDAGTCEWGHEVHTSYFSQDHHDLLNQSMTLFDWLRNEVNQVTEQQIRKTLGQLLFPREDAMKDILSISGGEAARVLLAKMMLESANVLLLDEPTNHLDIESIDSLAEALVQYTGTLICVSHNRHFVQKIANRILFISHDKGMQDFKGSYEEFREKTDL